MAHLPPDRHPRGINFLLGGTVVSIGFLLFVIFSDAFTLKLGGAPDVRIDDWGQQE